LSCKLFFIVAEWYILLITDVSITCYSILIYDVMCAYMYKLTMNTCSIIKIIIILLKMWYRFLLFLHKIYEPRHDKTNIMGLRPVWIQTSLRIRAVWSGSMLFAISFSTCYRVCKQTALILIRLHGLQVLVKKGMPNYRGYFW
jgi:hypothetical protein